MSKIKSPTKIIITGDWVCKERTRPWFRTKRYCEFNIVDDPSMDNCIHCGEPDERK